MFKWREETYTSLKELPDEALCSLAVSGDRAAEELLVPEWFEKDAKLYFT